MAGKLKRKQEESKDRDGKEDPKKINDSNRWIVADIPTAHTPMICDKKDSKAYTIEEALVLILNNQEILLEYIED